MGRRLLRPGGNKSRRRADNPLTRKITIDQVFYAGNNSLVSSPRLFRRWGFPSQYDPASGERYFGQSVPKPIRIAARRGVVFDGQCPVGNVQFGGGLCTGGPSWAVRPAADEACRCPGAAVSWSWH